MNQTMYTSRQLMPYGSSSVTDGSPATASMFMISTIEKNECSPSDFDPELGVARRASQMELIWITKGKGELIADYQPVPFHDNVVFCVTAGSTRFIRSDSAVEGYYLSLTSDYLSFADGGPDFSILTPRSLRNKVLVVNPGPQHVSEMHDVIAKMSKEFQQFNLLRSEILRSLFKVFAVYLSRNVQQHIPVLKGGREADMVDKFMVLVGKHFMAVKKVSDYAGIMCVTPNYLNQLVKRVSGFPASHHIQQHVIREAKRQAAGSTRCMKEIAENLGFNDCAHFSKFFKMYSGISFSTFRTTLIN